MTEKQSLPEPPDRQRRQAEEVVRARAEQDPENGSALSPDEVRRLLYDLRVHQIELEMQNDELRRVQHEIEASRTRYFDLYDLAPVGYLTVSERGLVLQANLTASGLLGVQRDELVNQHLTRFVLTEDQDLYFRLRRRLFETGTAQVSELRLVKKDAGVLWVRLQAAAPQTVDGAPAFRVVLSDVTERRRVEETLRASEARHRMLFERSHDALLILGPAPQWSVTSVNSAAVAMFGARSQAELALRPLWHHSPARQPDGGASPDKAQVTIDEAIREGSRFFDWTFKRVDGEEFAASVLLARMDIDGQPLLQATIRDETAMKKLQGDLAQADRLASMGMLAAGVAHEINNPLTYVLFNAETLADDLPRIASAATRCCAALRERVGDAGFAEVAGDVAALDPARLQDHSSRARELLVGAVQIRDIAQALGTFSRVESAKQAMVDLNYAIECAATMASTEIKFRATLVKDLRPVPAVWASEGQLSQVFLNLLINASRAIDEGQADKNRISIRTWVEGGGVFAEVKDTGKGIPPQNLSRVFEPFFTTKPGGQGSGLGLAICKTIITNFGGDIRVESEVGKATRFVVRMPVPAGSAKVSRANVPVEAAPVETARGRILVVDDEPLILGILKRLLGRQHEVVVAGSAEEGQAILEGDQSFDAIVCDLMMPGMTGMDLHAWLTQRFPELARRIVFLSGGAFTPRASQYLEGLPNTRLDKPIDVGALKGALSKLIEVSRTSRPKDC